MSDETILPLPLNPNQFGRAKVATTIVAVGGRAVLRGASSTIVRESVHAAIGQTAGRAVLRNGGKVAARVAPLLAVAEFGYDQYQTQQAYAAGEIDDRTFRRETGGNIGNASLGLGGAAAGAAVGSAILPGVGTIIGGILGGLFGGKVGREIGRDLAD